jgi:acyl-CoA synthetase (AMP-forming)/AMP-acid ligase II
MHLPILRNAHVYMLPSFTMDSMLATIAKYRIPEALLVPPIIIRLLRDPIVSNYDLSHLQTFSSGAAPISVELLQELERRFPGTGFKQGYGMTESCSCITTHPPDKQTYQYAHTVGTIVANTEVKIIDPESGRELGYNEPGEILARGPQVVMGYLGNEKATRETFDADGWLHTGDVGFIDREGFITITDRIKEMIKVKGIGVSPAELEDLLLGHPVVEDAAVTSTPDEYSGERPKAYVVVKPGVREKISGPDGWVELGRRLIDYVREKKVRHKWIEEVEFVDEIPKSASGKILRRVLRDQGRSGGRNVVVRGERKAKL